LSWGLLWRRPEIKLDIYRCDRKWWEIFKKHHYLTEDINKSAHCYIAFWEQKPIGFSAVLAMPSGSIKNAYRGHRTVILPDFQGLGLGNGLSNAIAQVYIDLGGRYFSRTANPRMGEYRQNSSLWKPTSKNKVLRTDVMKSIENGKLFYNNHVTDGIRICYSHEYIGGNK